jgi:hypothetical protein
VAENITGGAPSVLISRAVAEKGDFTDYVVANMRMCVEQDICNKNELYLSLTGNKGSPQPNGTAISSGYRTALLHYPHYENGGTSFESAKKVQAWGPKYVVTVAARLASIDSTRTQIDLRAERRRVAVTNGWLVVALSSDTKRPVTQPARTSARATTP